MEMKREINRARTNRRRCRGRTPQSEEPVARFRLAAGVRAGWNTIGRSLDTDQ
jgi:hypothetical protein